MRLHCGGSGRQSRNLFHSSSARVMVFPEPWHLIRYDQAPPQRLGAAAQRPIGRAETHLGEEEKEDSLTRSQVRLRNSWHMVGFHRTREACKSETHVLNVLSHLVLSVLEGIERSLLRADLDFRGVGLMRCTHRTRRQYNTVSRHMFTCFTDTFWCKGRSDTL